ncbi:DUF4846 domain-containing protein [Flavobacterium sp. LC2016-01]|uniref:DUF4846 domain-containing protein n=1 Tax=Flavobacterium sp. LC2016-01 TaxID=2675876 RepID=UPI001E414086|nr:DUF4846 domain-containing protein [Flavobacterium sp. LC2016-01]
MENTIQQRFQLPQGFVREEESKTSFDFFLRNLPLKSSGSNVLYFDGTTKPNKNVYEAVVDLPIGKQDLHQCADAVMRLRADYFYSQKQYDKIHFNFTNGFRADFSKWAAGYRIAIKGNKTSWAKTAKPSDSYETYWKYLETVFMYAGTASLEKELKPINISDIKIGDVFIKGGFPGHAVIVVDMAVNPKNNQKIMLLAQSYMPAQEIQILKNPNNSSLSPWYAVDFGTSLKTPEWTFSSSQLKRF